MKAVDEIKLTSTSNSRVSRKQEKIGPGKNHIITEQAEDIQRENTNNRTDDFEGKGV